MGNVNDLISMIGKKMEYSSKYERKILLEGKCKGYQFYILSLGTHPTAYIEIPSSSKLFRKNYDEIYYMGLVLDVHGGLTYSYSTLIDEKQSWFIGWDYMHGGDCFGTFLSGKKWTTEEIFDEVCYAIDQIIDFEKDEKIGDIVEKK